ncbi:MAG TPA: HAD-IA family hydrolase [Dongiaceae bacterium]|nr:HAD-IA family hydrolase [Dongiaceae bacterium]
MIKAIIFDCFGVLLGNAYKTHLVQVEQTDPEKAKEIRAINHASDMGILTREETADAISGLFGMDAEDFIAEQNQVEVPNTELLDYIVSLRKDFKTGLLSNISSRDRLSVRFAPGQLDAAFDTIVASGNEGYVKPEPEIYEITATRLGVLPHECLMIDDIAEFCDGARAVGMQAVQYISNQQCITDVNALLDRGSKKD